MFQGRLALVVTSIRFMYCSNEGNNGEAAPAKVFLFIDKDALRESRCGAAADAVPASELDGSFIKGVGRLTGGL